MDFLEGDLRKLRTTLDNPVTYRLCLDDQEWVMNEVIGQTIRLEYLGEIHCVQCGRKTSKSFQQGHCFVCMKRINECGNCIIHPERCRVEASGCPDDDWAHAQCNRPHVVYLANSSGLKVGITRDTQVPTRWMDQGAMQALPIIQVQNRYQAGLVEVAMKTRVADKTNWRVMLKQDSIMMDLVAERERLLEESAVELQCVFDQYAPGVIQPIIDAHVVTIRYPIKVYPEKISSLSFDKTPVISGVLRGIKGQYLILDHGVLNLRKFGGYRVSVALA